MTDAIHSLLAQQQVAMGMVAATIAGALLFSLKAVPGRLWTALRDLFSVTLCIEGGDPIYEHLSVWFARTDAAKKAQRLMAQPEYDYDRSEWRWKLTLGRGWHVIWFEGRPVFVNREVSEGGELAKLLGGRHSNHRLWLIAIGRRQATLRRILAEAERIYNDDGKVRVCFWHEGSYVLADRREPRSLDTVFLPAEQKARLVADIEAFSKAKGEYRRRGTPYRRGYLFKGDPGTGKTSLIFALAGLLNRAVYVINLASVSSDNALMAAFNEVGADGVVVIEDADAAEATHDRAAVEKRLAVPGGKEKDQPQRITLSGLLNAIDGVAAREGRILFVTSNYPEKLDPALIRPGRIDVQETIGPLTADVAWDMYCAFRPNGGRAEFERLVVPHLPMAAASVQNLLQGAEPEAEVIDLPARVSA